MIYDVRLTAAEIVLAVQGLKRTVARREAQAAQMASDPESVELLNKSAAEARALEDKLKGFLWPELREIVDNLHAPVQSHP